MALTQLLPNDVATRVLKACTQAWRRPLARWGTPQAAYLSWPAQPADAQGERERVDAALQAFATWCSERPGVRCELALGSAASLWHLVRHERPHADTLAAGWGEAMAQWAHYLDVDLRESATLAAWQLQEASAQGGSLLAATPLALVQGLKDVARAQGVKVAWMGPWWARGLALWMQGEGSAPSGNVERAWLQVNEPGWQWLAECSVDGPNQDRAWLAWSSATEVPQEGDGHVVTLDASGVRADRVSCVSVPLAMLQGHDPAWRRGAEPLT